MFDWNLKHDAFSWLGEGGSSMAFGPVPTSWVEFEPLAAATEIYSQSSKAARLQIICDQLQK